mmetsp:Transcript_30379/g.70418  ORF Transcript_30379/g.70418 Transcript_30379/m.70418 type:complete len:656 (+) Transcript_30379:1957-3924(+)
MEERPHLAPREQGCVQAGGRMARPPEPPAGGQDPRGRSPAARARARGAHAAAGLPRPALAPARVDHARGPSGLGAARGAGAGAARGRGALGAGCLAGTEGPRDHGRAAQGARREAGARAPRGQGGALPAARVPGAPGRGRIQGQARGLRADATRVARGPGAGGRVAREPRAEACTRGATAAAARARGADGNPVADGVAVQPRTAPGVDGSLAQPPSRGGAQGRVQAPGDLARPPGEGGRGAQAQPPRGGAAARAWRAGPAAHLPRTQGARGVGGRVPHQAARNHGAAAVRAAGGPHEGEGGHRQGGGHACGQDDGDARRHGRAAARAQPDARRDQEVLGLAPHHRRATALPLQVPQGAAHRAAPGAGGPPRRGPGPLQPARGAGADQAAASAASPPRARAAHRGDVPQDEARPLDALAREGAPREVGRDAHPALLPRHAPPWRALLVVPGLLDRGRRRNDRRRVLLQHVVRGGALGQAARDDSPCDLGPACRPRGRQRVGRAVRRRKGTSILVQRDLGRISLGEARRARGRGGGAGHGGDGPGLVQHSERDGRPDGHGPPHERHRRGGLAGDDGPAVRPDILPARRHGRDQVEPDAERGGGQSEQEGLPAATASEHRAPGNLVHLSRLGLADAATVRIYVPGSYVRAVLCDTCIY